MRVSYFIRGPVPLTSWEGCLSRGSTNNEPWILDHPFRKEFRVLLGVLGTSTNKYHVGESQPRRWTVLSLWRCGSHSDWGRPSGWRALSLSCVVLDVLVSLALTMMSQCALPACVPHWIECDLAPVWYPTCSVPCLLNGPLQITGPASQPLQKDGLCFWMKREVIRAVARSCVPVLE